MLTRRTPQGTDNDGRRRPPSSHYYGGDLDDLLVVDGMPAVTLESGGGKNNVIAPALIAIMAFVSRL